MDRKELLKKLRNIRRRKSTRSITEKGELRKLRKEVNSLMGPGNTSIDEPGAVYFSSLGVRVRTALSHGPHNVIEISA